MADYLLAVDTATPGGSVALFEGERLLCEFYRRLPGTHSEWLMKAIERLLDQAALQPADLKTLAVVHGPGSFTGLRVGMATVKGLAIGTDAEVLGVSSLEVLAAGLPFARLPVCSLLDARKQEVYAGLFDTSRGLPETLGLERVLPPEALLESLSGEVLFVGDGALAYRTLIVSQMGRRAHFAPATHDVLRAGLIGPLVRGRQRRCETVSLATLKPVYLRASEAEINWAKRHSEA